MIELISKQDAIEACGGFCSNPQDCIDEIKKISPLQIIDDEKINYDPVPVEWEGRP